MNDDTKPIHVWTLFLMPVNVVYTFNLWWWVPLLDIDVGPFKRRMYGLFSAPITIHFDYQSLYLAPPSPSKDIGSCLSTYHLTYAISQYMSPSYHHELSMHYAWRSVHPPLQPFLEVTTYQAHMSRVFACYSTASGLTFRPLLIYHHCYVWSIYRFRCLGCRKHSMVKGVASYTISQAHHSNFHKVKLTYFMSLATT